jgi:hypothetical protein
LLGGRRDFIGWKIEPKEYQDYKARKEAGMSYELKIKLSDIHYTYSGYPHDDEEFEISVWDGDTMIPIGYVAQVRNGAGDSFEDQRRALAEKYGDDFASKFLKVFSEDWWPELGEDEEVNCRLSLCARLETEEICRDLHGKDIEIEDVRSEESKKISRDLVKLDCVGSDDDMSSGESIAKELKEREKNGKFTRDETIKALCEIYDVCEDAAEWYIDTYCEYDYKE